MYYLNFLFYKLSFGFYISIIYRLFRSKFNSPYKSLSPNFYSKITFVIVTYNEESRIVPLLLSIPKEANILIIDNYSSDSTYELVKK